MQNKTTEQYFTELIPEVEAELNQNKLIDNLLESAVKTESTRETEMKNEVEQLPIQKIQIEIVSAPPIDHQKLIQEPLFSQTEPLPQSNTPILIMEQESTTSPASDFHLIKNWNLADLGRSSVMITLCFLVLISSIIASTLIAYACYRMKKSNEGSFKVGVSA